MPDSIKLYRRRTFDPDKHCGAPKDRSPETLKEKIERGEARLAAIREGFAGGEPTVIDLSRLKRIGQRVSFYGIELAKIEKHGPDNRPCMNRKGQGTTHPGINLCENHCECKGKQDWHLDNKSTYSPKNRKLRISKILDEMAMANHDVMDMEPLLMTLEAKMKDFIDQKGDDLDAESIKSATLLAEQIRRQWDSMNDKRFKASISMDMYNLILYKMSEVLMKYVTDPEILDKITDGWSRIAVEQSATKGGQALMAGRSES